MAKLKQMLMLFICILFIIKAANAESVCTEHQFEFVRSTYAYQNLQPDENGMLHILRRMRCTICGYMTSELIEISSDELKVSEYGILSQHVEAEIDGSLEHFLLRYLVTPNEQNITGWYIHAVISVENLSANSIWQEAERFTPVGEKDSDDHQHGESIIRVHARRKGESDFQEEIITIPFDIEHQPFEVETSTAAILSKVCECDTDMASFSIYVQMVASTETTNVLGYYVTDVLPLSIWRSDNQFSDIRNLRLNDVKYMANHQQIHLYISYEHLTQTGEYAPSDGYLLINLSERRFSISTEWIKKNP